LLRHVKRYLEIFGPKQVKIIIFEEFRQNPKETIEEILHFLGLSKTLQKFENYAFHASTTKKRRGASNILDNPLVIKIAKLTLSREKRFFVREKIFSKKIEKPEIPQKEKETLQKLYYDDVKTLEILLKRKLPWKNFNL